MRFGQRKPVTVVRLYINDTIEDRLREIQSRKIALSNGVFNEV